MWWPVAYWIYKARMKLTVSDEKKNDFVWLVLFPLARKNAANMTFHGWNSADFDCTLIHNSIESCSVNWRIIVEKPTQSMTFSFELHRVVCRTVSLSLFVCSVLADELFLHTSLSLPPPSLSVSHALQLSLSYCYIFVVHHTFLLRHVYILLRLLLFFFSSFNSIFFRVPILSAATLSLMAHLIVKHSRHLYFSTWAFYIAINFQLASFYRCLCYSHPSKFLLLSNIAHNVLDRLVRFGRSSTLVLCSAHAMHDCASMFFLNSAYRLLVSNRILFSNVGRIACANNLVVVWVAFVALDNIRLIVTNFHITVSLFNFSFFLLQMFMRLIDYLYLKRLSQLTVYSIETNAKIVDLFIELIALRQIAQ